MISETGGQHNHGHTHNITGTLVCHPDSNTVRLNISLLPPTSSADSKHWPPASSDSLLTAKHEPGKHWSQVMTKPAPVSHPGQYHDPVVPPLLDFQPDQLLSDIQNIFPSDLKEQLAQLPQLPQLYNDADPRMSLAPVSSMGSNPLLSQHHSLPPPHSRPVTSITPVVTTGHQTLLQPKLERSDSICSEFTPLKEEFLNSYSDDLTGLDDIDNENSITPPTSITSPLLFSPTQKPVIPPPATTSSTSNTIFFNKSFESNNSTTKLNINNSVASGGQQQQQQQQFYTTAATTTTQFQNEFINNTETRKPFNLSHNESPKSFSSSPVSSPHETPVTLLTSPKSRNRRNSSFDETKPHVCGQCGARFTTKSNLGQHAKIHLAVKPFICEICNHGFTRAAHYESHVAKHKGLKTHR